MEKHKDLFFTNTIQIIDETEKLMLESMNIKNGDYENWKTPSDESEEERIIKIKNSLMSSGLGFKELLDNKIDLGTRNPTACGEDGKTTVGKFSVASECQFGDHYVIKIIKNTEKKILEEELLADLAVEIENQIIGYVYLETSKKRDETLKIDKISVPVIIPKIFVLTNSKTKEKEYAIIMQHGGESLDPQKHREAMFEESSGLMEQLLKIPEVFDRYGFIHLDLKPQNVLMSPEGELNIIDFGGAQYGSDFNEKDILVFTANYLAPDCWDLYFSDERLPKKEDKKKCLETTDKYAVNNMCYEFCSGTASDSSKLEQMREVIKNGTKKEELKIAELTTLSKDNRNALMNLCKEKDGNTDQDFKEICDASEKKKEDEEKEEKKEEEEEGNELRRNLIPPLDDTIAQTPFSLL